VRRFNRLLMFEGDSNARKIIALTAFVCVIGGLMIAGQVSAAGGTAPKVDCSQKKNAKKIECKEAPKSDIKPAIKKPEKVDRKAPKSMQKKAAEENAKK
jgi:hypothetical protein